MRHSHSPLLVQVTPWLRCFSRTPPPKHELLNLADVICCSVHQCCFLLVFACGCCKNAFALGHSLTKIIFQSYTSGCSPHNKKQKSWISKRHHPHSTQKPCRKSTKHSSTHEKRTKIQRNKNLLTHHSLHTLQKKWHRNWLHPSLKLKVIQLSPPPLTLSAIRKMILVMGNYLK